MIRTVFSASSAGRLRTRCETGVDDAMKDKDRISERERKDRIATRLRNALNRNALKTNLLPLRSLETATRKRRAQKKRAADAAAAPSTETISTEAISDKTFPGR